MDNIPVLGTDSSGKLYEKSLNFRLKESSSSLSSNTVRLCLTIEWKSLGSSAHNKELLINLTDPLDPFFLYTTVLKRDDFLILKQQQGLLVDFLTFPQSFISLLELCVKEENRIEPKYLLYLVIQKASSCPGTAQLDIVETNQFKLLTHLSLKLVTPSESVVKQYLTSCFRNVKEEKEQLENKARFLEQELKKKEYLLDETLSSKNENYNALKKEREAEISTMKQQYEQKLKQEKQKANALLNAERKKFREEKSELMTTHGIAMKAQQRITSDLDEENKKLKEEIEKLEESEANLHAHVKALEIKLKDAQDSRKTYSKRNSDMSSELKELKQELQLLRKQRDELAEESVSQAKCISDMEEKLKVTLGEKESLEDSLMKTSSELEKTQRQERALTKDIAKANDIIRKMQGEARNFNEQLKSRGKLALRLEEVVHEKDTKISVLEQELSSALLLLKDQKNEVTVLVETIAGLKLKLSETEHKLQTKEEILKIFDDRLYGGHGSLQKLSAGSSAAENIGLGKIATQGDSNQNENLLHSVEPTATASGNVPQQVTPTNAVSNPPPTIKPHLQPQSLHPRYLERHPNFFASYRQNRQADNDDYDDIQEIYRNGSVIQNQCNANPESYSNSNHVPTSNQQ